MLGHNGIIDHTKVKGVSITTIPGCDILEVIAVMSGDRDKREENVWRELHGEGIEIPRSIGIYHGGNSAVVLLERKGPMDEVSNGSTREPIIVPKGCRRT